MDPCLKGSSPQCRSARPGWTVNWSKLIIHQVMQLEFKPWWSYCIALAFTLFTIQLYTVEENNSTHLCSQPFGFWQTGAAKARGKHEIPPCFKTVWEPGLSHKCSPKEHLPAILTVSINHSPKHTLHLSATERLLVSAHYLLPSKVAHTVGLLMFNSSCSFWPSCILKSFSNYIHTQFRLEMGTCCF